MELETKLANLRALLGELPSALVAFSGGVDSAFLLRVAHEVLGERCIALTTLSPTTPREDVEDAKALATSLGVHHVLLEANELAIAGYAENPVNRCYFCKDNLFVICVREAGTRGLAAVLDGANLDDLGDHRPGLTAAAEQGVRHPLIEARFSKDDIRAASRALGLRTWDRPASPCLSSRFPYGTRITAERLGQVESAEGFLRALGFRELRVRYHEQVARLELPIAEMPRLLEPGIREQVVQEMKRLGFAYVALDLQGFRSGSLNEPLRKGSQKHEGAEGNSPRPPRIR